MRGPWVMMLAPASFGLAYGIWGDRMRRSVDVGCQSASDRGFEWQGVTLIVSTVIMKS